MEAEIREILRTASEPMTALDIAKKLSKPKKEVNSALYKMSDVDKPNGNPPRWRLKTAPLPGGSTPSTNSAANVPPLTTESTAAAVSSSLLVVSTDGGATPSKDHQAAAAASLKERITKLLTSTGQSAPDIHKQLNDVPMREVKSTLHNSGIAENIAPEGSKPLWVKAGSATKLPASDAKTSPVTLKGKELYQKEENEDGIMFRKVRDGDLVDDEVRSKPTSSSDKPLTASNDTSSQLETGMASLNLKDEDLKQAVLACVQADPDKDFTARNIADQLGKATRDEVMYCLEQLCKEGQVEATNDRSAYKAVQ